MSREGGTGFPLVLVVEDDEELLRTEVELIRYLGYFVLSASTAEEALHLLALNTRISVLFSDVGLPDMLGTDLADKARRMRPEIAVILTSGQHRAVEYPFVAKPFRINDLLTHLPRQIAA